MQVKFCAQDLPLQQFSYDLENSSQWSVVLVWLSFVPAWSKLLYLSWMISCIVEHLYLHGGGWKINITVHAIISMDNRMKIWTKRPKRSDILPYKKKWKSYTNVILNTLYSIHKLNTPSQINCNLKRISFLHWLLIRFQSVNGFHILTLCHYVFTAI